MFKSISSLTGKLTSSIKKSNGENDKIENEALMLLQREVEAVSRDLDALPNNRVPNIKFKRAIDNTRQQMDAILAPIGKTHKELEAAVILEELELELKMVTLQRYAHLIETAKDVNPFASFAEFSKVIEGVNLQDAPELLKWYQKAMKALFTHAHFPHSIIEKIGNKLAVLAQQIPQNEAERQKITLFLSQYDQNVFYNSALKKNKLLEVAIGELEAMVFFQEQIAFFQQGGKVDDDAIADDINRWMHHFNALSQEEQQQRMPLILVADECSRLYNESSQE